MVDSLLTLPGSAPAPTALYCHTQSLHAALQGWWLESGLFGGMLDQQAYRNILTRLHRCFSMLEHELTSRHAGLLDEIGYLPRLSLLDDDLAELIRLLGGCSRDQLRQLITQLETLPSV